MFSRRSALVALLAAVSAAGCLRSDDSEVVVYTALDREFSEPILEDFAVEAGVTVLPKFDVESTKTVGLVGAIMQESDRPRCDVFWNNEILHTLRLQEQGLLEAYDLPNADKFPSEYRSPDGFWYGLAARARVLIVNTEILSEDEWPSSVGDLAGQEWKDRAGMAKPLFGTTATHAAVLFARWGDSRAQEFFRQVHGNVHVLSGNRQVAQAVGQGRLAFGITDTDDAIIEIEKGLPVTIVYPDQGDGAMGTLFIPNTLCIIRGAPNTANARRLLDYLLTPEVEVRLARGASAQFPLHVDVEEQPRVHQPGVRHMEVDFQAAARKWDTVADFLRGLFAAAD